MFSHAAFAALKAGDAAFVVVHPETREVVWANLSAARFFEASSLGALATILFGAEGQGGGWLEGLAQGVVTGRPPRLSRGGLSRGFRMRSHTALIQAIATSSGDRLLAFAVPDACAPESDGETWRQPAWPIAPQRTGDDVASTGEALPDPSEPGDGIDDDAASSGVTLARRSQIAILHDRLTQALDGAATLRLLWRTDNADRVTEIDAEAVSRLGSRVPFLGGASLPDVVATFDTRGGEQLRAALASRATWSGITFDLPVSDGVAQVPMVLSGSPVLGPGRVFAGFRGFGTVDLGRLDLAPPRQFEAAADPEAPILSEPSTLELPAPSELQAEEPAIVDRPSEPSPGYAEEPNVSPPSPANVVHLRAFQSLALGRLGGLPGDATTAAVSSIARAPVETPHGGGALEDVSDPQSAASPHGVDLAFLALGEALRARIGGLRRVDEPAEAEATTSLEAEPVVADTRPAGAEERASPDEGRHETASADDLPSQDAVRDAPEMVSDVPTLLREMPLPLIVTVGSSPVFANQRAATLLGYDPTVDFAGAAQDVLASADRGSVTTRDAQGREVTVQARPADISWGGAPAVLWILEQAAEPEPIENPQQSHAVAEDAEVGAGELLDRVDDAVALLDVNGLVRRLNHRGESWFENALGRSFTQLLTPESRPGALALLGDVRVQKDGLGAPPLRHDVQARVGRGTLVPMILTLGRLGTAGFYLTLRDVSALKQAETERAGAERDQVRDADRLPALLGKVSHEIRTPLNAILGFAEVMMDERFGPLGNPRYKDYLKDIHTSGTQVMTLVEDLLDLSRIEAGQLDLAVEPLDVNRLVAETVAQMQPEAHRQRVIMRTSLGGRIPAVLADERSARQIVRNLLSNAVKFNEPGGQVIISTALSDSGTVLLRVRDTGVGMTDDEIAAALEPFGGGLPSHAANGNGSGNGLGLPLTRALVGVNGASMAISSRPREGTLVEVAFASAGAVGERRPA